MSLPFKGIENIVIGESIIREVLNQRNHRNDSNKNGGYFSFL